MIELTFQYIYINLFNVNVISRNSGGVNIIYPPYLNSPYLSLE